MHRPSYFVAVEMENSLNEPSKVWYGRLLRLMAFDLDLSTLCEYSPLGEAHDKVAILDRRKRPRKESNGQVY